MLVCLPIRIMQRLLFADTARNLRSENVEVDRICMATNAMLATQNN